MKKIVYKDNIYLNTSPPTINNINLYGNHSLKDLGFINALYPIGCYYETSNGNFNPEAQWGGQWELEIEGQIHVAQEATVFPTIAGALNNQSDGGTINSIVAAHTHNYWIGDVNHAHSTIAMRPDYDETGNLDAMVTWGWLGYSATCYSSNAGNHTHTLASNGVSGAGRNMPPHINVYRWHRIG